MTIAQAWRASSVIGSLAVPDGVVRAPCLSVPVAATPVAAPGRGSASYLHTPGKPPSFRPVPCGRLQCGETLPWASGLQCAGSGGRSFGSFF